ncbi:FG-GAP repeat domain-containing protein [Nocardioides sp.]|uniref:FG-GAP repeat domain-containing protein n=1 Tax=Nocardioides sp. TaxID=35761 RepID=UPI003568A162
MPPAVAGFTTSGDFTVGTKPRSIAIGNLNGDDHLDMAVVNSFSDNVSILLGTTEGSFGPATNFTTSPFPMSVSIGDLNGDGASDLVVGNGVMGLNTSVDVLTGTGTGSFGPPTSFDTGTTDPWQVVLGNFTGDGSLDIATASRFGAIAVLPGTGSGTFLAATTYPVGAYLTSIAAGDLNGDSRADLVAADADSDKVGVLLADGAGSFDSVVDYAVGHYPTSVAVGNLNGDAYPDVVVVDGFDDNASILLNAGTGVFGPRTTVATGDNSTSVAIGDLNQDTRADLAVTNRDEDTVAVLAGDGTGSFGEAADIPTGSQPAFVAIGNLNLDDLPDLAVATGDGEVSVFAVDPPAAPVLKAKIGKVKLKGSTKARRGKKSTYTVIITNSGQAAATGVTIKVRGKGIGAKVSVGTIRPAETTKAKVKFWPKKSGKVKVAFKITSKNAGNRTVTKNLTVKK